MVAAVEAIGDTEYGRQLDHQAPGFGRELGQLFVRRLRRCALVKPGDRRDHRDLFGRKAAEFPVGDQILRMAMVLAVIHVKTDVVE